MVYAKKEMLDFNLYKLVILFAVWYATNSNTSFIIGCVESTVSHKAKDRLTFSSDIVIMYFLSYGHDLICQPYDK